MLSKPLFPPVLHPYTSTDRVEVIPLTVMFQNLHSCALMSVCAHASPWLALVSLSSLLPCVSVKCWLQSCLDCSLQGHILQVLGWNQLMPPNKHVEVRSKGGKLLPRLFFGFFTSYAACRRELFSGAGSTAQLLFSCLNSPSFSLPQTRRSGVNFFQNIPDLFCPLRRAKALGKYALQYRSKWC